jgi:hypothetical protein
MPQFARTTIAIRVAIPRLSMLFRDIIAPLHSGGSALGASSKRRTLSSKTTRLLVFAPFERTHCDLSFRCRMGLPTAEAALVCSSFTPVAAITRWRIGLCNTPAGHDGDSPRALAASDLTAPSPSSTRCPRPTSAPVHIRLNQSFQRLAQVSRHIEGAMEGHLQGRANFTRCRVFSTSTSRFPRAAQTPLRQRLAVWL